MTTTNQRPRTWGDLCSWIWEHHYQFTRSKDTARSVLSNAPIGDDVKIGSVDRQCLRRMITRLRVEGKEDATVRRYLSVVMKTLREAHKEGLVDTVPYPPALPRPAQGRLRWLDHQEQKELIQKLVTVDGPLHAYLVQVLVDTGLRLGEALNLSWEDCDMGGRRVTVTESKNGQPRVVPMTEAVYTTLERCEKVQLRGGHLLRGPFAAVRSWSFHRAWNRAKAEMGLDHDQEFVPHCLRHTFASRLVQLGAGLQVVQQLLGHRRLENTLIYAHLAPEQHQGAIKLLEQMPAVPIPTPGSLRGYGL